MVRYTLIILIVAGTLAAAVTGQCPPKNFIGDPTSMPQQVCDAYNGQQGPLQELFNIISQLITQACNLLSLGLASCVYQVGYVGDQCISYLGQTSCLPNSACTGHSLLGVGVGTCKCNSGTQANQLPNGNKNICVAPTASGCHANTDCDHSKVCVTVSGSGVCQCPIGTTFNATYGPYVEYDNNKQVIVVGRCVCDGEHPNALYNPATGTCPCNGNAAFYNTTTLRCQPYTNARTVNYAPPSQEFGYSMCPGDIIPNTATHDCSCPDGMKLGVSDAYGLIKCLNITTSMN